MFQKQSNQLDSQGKHACGIDKILEQVSDGVCVSMKLKSGICRAWVTQRDDP
jgi:hypothetical protein